MLKICSSLALLFHVWTQSGAMLHSGVAPVALSAEEKNSLTSFIRTLSKLDCRFAAQCEDIVELADWPACRPLVQDNNTCLVYSFGVANDWDFEAAAGHLGCEVFAFDPTTNYVSDLAPGVQFEQLGLCGTHCDHMKRWSHRAYGQIQGPLFNLLDIQAKLRHQGRTISVLKIDCEGCEWSALHYLASVRPSIFEQIDQINIEFHFTTTLQVNSTEALQHIAATYALLMAQGYRPWYSFPQGGKRGDREVLPELREYGFPKELCCYEVGLIKKRASKLRRGPITPFRPSLLRPQSVFKWGQVCYRRVVQYVSHTELSNRGTGYTTPELVQSKLLKPTDVGNTYK